MKRFLRVCATASYQRIIITAFIVGTISGTIIIGYQAFNRPQPYGRLGANSIRITQKPVPVTKRPPGPVPSQPPRLTRVFPWVGKVGDIVLIEGEQFGNNPIEKQLSIGGIRITEAHILDWTDREIQAFIPDEAAHGERIEVRIGTHPAALSLPMSLYDRATKLQLKKTGTIISASSPDQIHSIRWWGTSGNSVKMHEVTRSAFSDSILFDTQGEEIRSLLLYDTTGASLPYYVDPDEFGF